MKSLHALANKAFTSVLGQLGAGASGGVTNNELSQTNAAPIAPGVTARWDSSPFVPRTGRVEITGSMTLSKNGGTLAAGDVVTFQLVRDSGGGQVAVGSQSRVTVTAAGADAIASGALTWIDALVTPGTTHTYGLLATIAGGHTGGILTNEAAITLSDV
jgi:hypothetical protein